LAARLQSIAKPGGIVISYETFALVSDVVAAHSLAPILIKGISREVIPYLVDDILDTSCDGGDFSGLAVQVEESA
jgi:adenylate cyclase